MHTGQVKRRSRMRYWLGAFAFVAAVGAGVTLLAKAAPVAVEPKLTTAKKSDGVGALGRLEPGWKIHQLAPCSAADGARVETLLFDEGDLVKAGDLMATLDVRSRRDAAYREAQAHERIAQAKLAQVKAGPKADEVAAQNALVAKQRIALQHAESMLKRANNLRSGSSLSIDEYEQRRTDLEVARELLKQAESTLAALKQIRPEDVLMAEADLAKAQAGVVRCKAELDAAEIRSPINGRILKVNSRPGERISEQGLLDVGNTDGMHAVAEVYERDAPRVKIGQKAVVKVQSLPDEIPGRVVRVGWKVGRQAVFDNDPVKDTDARVVEVRIKLEGPLATKVGGLSYARVEVRIDTPEAP